MQRITTVILDLDNTLFDWVEIWYKSFSAMLEQLVQRSGIEQEKLLSDFKAVFTRHGTSEYAFAIEELESYERNIRRRILQRFMILRFTHIELRERIPFSFFRMWRIPSKN